MRELTIDLPDAVAARAGASSMSIRAMPRHELDVLVDWAAGEGWNPGQDDAEVFWATDPDGFVAADIGGELVGGGSIVTYGSAYGFMGLFIVRPDLRHEGLGRSLWHARKALLEVRLDPGAAIEMDGVFEMQPFYAKGGFTFQHRDLRFAGRAETITASSAPDAGPGAVPSRIGLVDVADIPFAPVAAYDRAHFPAERAGFLQRWISLPGGHAVAATDDAGLRGLAVARPCRTGHKIGPLFAEDPAVAAALFHEVCDRVGGGEVFIDAPECNRAAVDLAQRHGMVEVFGCARMTLGPPPALPWDEIFGVTTFELG